MTRTFFALFSAVALLASSAPAQINTGSYQVHLDDAVRFNPTKPGSNAMQGQALFGLAADGMSEDPSQALFEGFSQAAMKNIDSNGRTCFTCHRGEPERFGLPVPPLSDTIPLTDTLFTEFDADAQGDPDAFDNLDERGLIKYRPNRFNSARSLDDPYRQAFGWRKSPKLLNIGLSQGFLTDGRGRVMFETIRGAIFSHTQDGDERFDDLFSDFTGMAMNPLQNGHDMEAFQFEIFSDPQLAALRDPNHPMHRTLVRRPFYTVDARTPMQRLGKAVFIRNCFSCHNTPNVFNNLSNVEALGNGNRPDNFVPWGPMVGRAFNVGISERNAHNLRFTRFAGEGPGGEPTYEPIVIPLADEDGSINNHVIETDLGLALTTGRTEDIGRFKVPQLRDLIHNAPYFHDNSAATIEEVVDYFNSPQYNNSKDGKKFPIHLSPLRRAALIEFLKIL